MLVAAVVVVAVAAAAAAASSGAAAAVAVRRGRARRTPRLAIGALAPAIERNLGRLGSHGLASKLVAGGTTNAMLALDVPVVHESSGGLSSGYMVLKLKYTTGPLLLKRLFFFADPRLVRMVHTCFASFARHGAEQWVHFGTEYAFFHVVPITVPFSQQSFCRLDERLATIFPYLRMARTLLMTWSPRLLRVRVVSPGIRIFDSIYSLACAHNPLHGSVLPQSKDITEGCHSSLRRDLSM